MNNYSHNTVRLYEELHWRSQHRKQGNSACRANVHTLDVKHGGTARALAARHDVQDGRDDEDDDGYPMHATPYTRWPHLRGGATLQLPESQSRGVAHALTAGSLAAEQCEMFAL